MRFRRRNRLGWLPAVCLFSLAAAWAYPLVGPGAGAEEESSGAIHWHKDLQTARAEAAKSGKPLFVVFRCVP